MKHFRNQWKQGARTFARLAAALCIASLLFCVTAFSQQRSLKVELGVGESVRVREANFTIFFKEVVEDSRCPEGVNCIQAGDAVITIRITRANDSPVSYTLHSNSDLKNEAEVGALKVQLMTLTPAPVAGLSTRPDGYRVTLLIGRK